MAAILVSHSSADNQAAGQLRARLQEHGFHSVFLDLDKQGGIIGRTVSRSTALR